MSEIGYTVLRIDSLVWGTSSGGLAIWATGQMPVGPSSLTASVLGRCTREHFIVDLSTDLRPLSNAYNAFTISD
jgi:hypothetical protein